MKVFIIDPNNHFIATELLTLVHLLINCNMLICLLYYIIISYLDLSVFYIDSLHTMSFKWGK